MPQCKLDGCREPALPTGKRYCAYHKAEYLRKQKEANARRDALPRCALGCGEPVNMGCEGYCRTCYENQQREREEQEKWQQFYEAETVEELKTWMTKHLL